MWFTVCIKQHLLHFLNFNQFVNINVDIIVRFQCKQHIPNNKQNILKPKTQPLTSYIILLSVKETLLAVNQSGPCELGSCSFLSSYSIAR